MKQINFISGLPRSGSTLFAAILAQNPDISASMSSPVSSIFCNALQTMGMSEFAGFIDDGQRHDILKGVIEGYYRDAPPFVFDTSRMWTARMGAILSLYPDAKVIACVRDLLWVVDSFELLTRRNPLLISRMFPPDKNTSVFARAHFMMDGNGMVGLPYNALQEAFYGEHSDRLILIDYETLVRSPSFVISTVYDLLGLPVFEHDFENVRFDDGNSFDEWIGAPGLHTIRPKVEPKPRQTILPPDLAKMFDGAAFWKQEQSQSKASVIYTPPVSFTGITMES